MVPLGREIEALTHKDSAVPGGERGSEQTGRYRGDESPSRDEAIDDRIRAGAPATQAVVRGLAAVLGPTLPTADTDRKGLLDMEVAAT